MAALSIAEVPANVTVGVDTHKHSHIARAKDGLGRHLGQLEIEADPRGYAGLLAWAQGFGPVVTFGIEGTSSYGAGLTRFLRAQGQAVIEVLRPVRRDRRFGGKSDPIDADAAAVAACRTERTRPRSIATETVTMSYSLSVPYCSGEMTQARGGHIMKTGDIDPGHDRVLVRRRGAPCVSKHVWCAESSSQVAAIFV